MSDWTELKKFLKSTDDILKRATATALTRTMIQARTHALKNARRQFTGRNNRRLSGQLFNSIYSTVKVEKGTPTGILGTRGIPYGRIHELGGEITPLPKNRMQRLWIPAREHYNKRITPREFISELRRDRQGYFLSDKVAGEYRGPGDVLPYFWLVERVEMPERPYLRPAISTAFEDFEALLLREFETEAARQ